MRHLTIFDLDHTLIKGNSSFLFGVFLYKQGHLPFLTMLKLTSYYAFYKIKLFSIQKMQNKIFYAYFARRSQSEIQQLAERFMEQNFDQLLRCSVLESLTIAKEQGHFTALLSSSPSFLVELFAKRLNIDFWDATHFVAIEGKFAYISQLVFGIDKAEYVKRLSEEYALSREEMTAYSDSSEDLPLLEAVGNPIAVAPDRQLERICKERSWTILYE